MNQGNNLFGMIIVSIVNMEILMATTFVLVVAMEIYSQNISNFGKYIHTFHSPIMMLLLESMIYLVKLIESMQNNKKNYLMPDFMISLISTILMFLSKLQFPKTMLIKMLLIFPTMTMMLMLHLSNL